MAALVTTYLMIGAPTGCGTGSQNSVSLLDAESAWPWTWGAVSGPSGSSTRPTTGSERNDRSAPVAPAVARAVSVTCWYGAPAIGLPKLVSVEPSTYRWYVEPGSAELAVAISGAQPLRPCSAITGVAGI